MDQLLIQKAMEVATKAHEGQKDKAGKDYILHPLTLAKHCFSEETIICALLHDVMEDTDFKREELLSIFGNRIVEVLDCLTHDSRVDYFEYVSHIKNNPIARCVKLEDLYHNSDLSRIPNPTLKDQKRVLKYKKAIAFLLENIEEDAKEYPELLQHIR